MKKGVVLILISIFLQTIIAENLKPFVETSYSRITIDGNMDSFYSSANNLTCYDNFYEFKVEDNQIEENKINVNIGFDYSTERKESDLYFSNYNYAMINSLKGDEEVDIYSNLRFGYIGYLPLAFNIPLCASIEVPYTSLSYNSNGSNIVNGQAEVSLGFGRIYSIGDVTLAKLIMDALGVVQTEEKIKKVAKILDKEDKIKNKYDFESKSPASYKYLLDYYQSIADALGIPNRVEDVLTVINWNYMRNASYRNRYINLSKGLKLKAYVNKYLEYKFNYPNENDNGFLDTNFVYGAEASACGEIIKNRLFSDITVRYYFNLNDTFEIQYQRVRADTKFVYFPDSTNLLYEIAANGYYNIESQYYSYDASAAIHYILDRDIVLYSGLQYSGDSIDEGDYGVFVGCKIYAY